MMRTFLLTTVWFLGYALTAFPQQHFPFQADTNSTALKMDHPLAFVAGDSLNIKGKLDVPFKSKNLPYVGFKNKGFSGKQQVVANRKNTVIMPVFKPQNSYNMPVYQPDSTIRFTLLIKDYKSFQNK